MPEPTEDNDKNDDDKPDAGGCCLFLVLALFVGGVMAKEALPYLKDFIVDIIKAIKA